MKAFNSKMWRIASAVAIFLAFSQGVSAQTFMKRYNKITEKNLPKFITSWESWSDSLALEAKDEDLLVLWEEEFGEEMDIDGLEITRQDIDGDGIEEILMSYPVEGGSGMFLTVSAADNCLSTILAGTGSNGYWDVHDNGMVSYTTSSGRYINEEADCIFDEMTIASYAKVKDSRLLYSLCIMTEIKDDIDPETVTEENYDSCFFHHCTLDLDSMELVIPYEEALKLIPNE